MNDQKSTVLSKRPKLLSSVKKGSSEPFYIFVKKGLMDRGTILSKDADLGNIIKDEHTKDWYKSVYFFPKEVSDFFKKDNSIKGYEGEAYCDSLIFDIDNKNDFDAAQKSTVQILDRLGKEGVDILKSVNVYFSGCKGFHIITKFENEKFSPTELKTICTNIAGDLVGFDTKIYNANRVLRVCNTKHPITGLYKIELEPQELIESNYEGFKEKAKQPSNNFITAPIKDGSFLDKYREAKKSKSVVVEYEQTEGSLQGLDKVDFERCGNDMPRCLYAASQGVMQTGVGKRNAIFLRLAAYYRNQGLPKEAVIKLLEGVSELNHAYNSDSDAFPVDEIKAICCNVFRGRNNFNKGSWGASKDNEELKELCEMVGSATTKRCKLHYDSGKPKDVVEIGEIAEGFKNFAQNYSKNIVKTGLEFVDKYMQLSVGTVTLLVGGSGSGKTSVALNVLQNSNELNQYCMMFSLDMHRHQLFLKLAKKVTNMSKDRIMAAYESNDANLIADIKRKISEKYGKTFFDFSSTLTMDEMREKVQKIEEEQNIKIKLVIVDYASRITGPYSDRYANATFNALKSKEVADVTDAAWIFISQISRNLGDGCTPLRTKRAAKESGDWEEASQNVITCWRPFMGSQETNDEDLAKDNIMRLFMAKNRMGPELEQPLHWNGSRGIVKCMTNEELREYEETRQPEEREFLRDRLGR